MAVGYPAGIPYPAPARKSKNGLGVAALVCGIVGLVLPIALPAVAAVICGHMGVAAAKRGEADNKGMSVAGLVLGYVGVALVLVLVFFGLLALAGALVDYRPEPDESTSYLLAGL
jgi:hypothetical protein